MEKSNINMCSFPKALLPLIFTKLLQNIRSQRMFLPFHSTQGDSLLPLYGDLELTGRSGLK